MVTGRPGTHVRREGAVGCEGKRYRGLVHEPGGSRTRVHAHARRRVGSGVVSVPEGFGEGLLLCFRRAN